MNYKCNNEFRVGVYANSEQLPESVTLIPTDGQWKKIYISLTDDLQTRPFENYRVYIHMLKASDVSVGEVYLDNIKLVHF